MSESEDDSYGPALPPGFQDNKRKHSPSASDDDSFGPALPDNLKQRQTDDNIPPKSDNAIGPVIPSHLQKSAANYSSDSDSDSSSESESESRSCKKQKLLPDTNVTNTNKKSGTVIGPSLPPGMDLSSVVSGPNRSEEIPAIDDDDDDDDDDDGYVIGPSLNMQASETEQLSAAAEFEQRAQRMKDKLEGKITEEEEPKGRETWMTELPSNMGVKFGLENRQFRKNAAPEQDSSWTETPQDKERKEQEGKTVKKEDTLIPNTKDLAMTRDIDEYNKKNRPKSLLEMHQKKQKKEKKKKEKKEKKEKKKSKKKGKDKDKDDREERRPFDRDVDLQVNKLDEAQKRAIIKRSQELGSRFKSGGMGTSFL